ncbi:UNVERIFIED_CONTAM: hypothetical protein Slati_2610100 [Sesamum latifolium]|uniref:Uncharacterized protein n=1 Tax=Sesamum latifolium TaxID=2727402 RepID=A0AAW2VTM1_9LAMI
MATLSLHWPITLLYLCVLFGCGHGTVEYGTKRLVPSGPNRQEPPEIPSHTASYLYGYVKRLVPSGPDPVEPPESYLSSGNSKRLVPSGPDPVEPPESYLSSGNSKRLVPSGPDPVEPPEAVYSRKRLVPSGPNREEPPAIRSPLSYYNY